MHAVDRAYGSKLTPGPIMTRPSERRRKWPSQWGATSELRRYDGLRTLRCEADGGVRLALVADPSTDVLRRIARAHERVRAPEVASIVDSGRCDEGEYLLFDCDVVGDLEGVALELTSRKTKIPYPAAIAFNEFLMDAIDRVHSAGAGFFGAIGWSNVLVGPDGRLWLFGLGYNFPVRHRSGSLRGGFGVVEAPELLLGSPPTTASDVYLLHATLRGMLPYVELLPMFELALKRADERSVAIYAELASLSAGALEPEPTARIPTVAALRARYRAVRQLVPEMPAPAHAMLAELIAGALPPARAAALSVDHVRRSVELGGEVVELGERIIHWRMLCCLIDAHASAAAVSTQQLFAAGWPGERVQPAAARARVYVCISALRKTALGQLIQKSAEGYFLSPSLTVRLVGP